MKKNDIDGCLLMIMRCLWDANEELTSREIRERMNKRFNKEYSLENICVFMSRLRKRGYVNSHKEGKMYYYLPAVSEKTVRMNKLSDYINFWHEGSIAQLFNTYCLDNNLSENDFMKLVQEVKK